MDSELEAMGKVLAALQGLEPDVQERVMRWTVDKLKLNASLLFQRSQLEPVTAPTSSNALPSSINVWMNQNGLTDNDLESVFHFSGSNISLVVAQPPGASGREKTINCYILAGLTALLRSGEALFTDKEARDLCSALGCFNTNHHANYLGSRGNEFVGSKEKGWTLTAPGKKRAAELVKEIAAA